MTASAADPGFRIRPAQARDAAALTDLAHRSKAVWGHDAAFMRAAAADLTLTPERIAAAPAYLAERAGRAIGFYTFSPPADGRHLTHLFVDPELLRCGVGQALWHHAIGQARAAGWTAFEIESDPDAEAFYLRMGARRIGTAPSIVSPQRRLPLLRMELPPPPAAENPLP